VGDVIKSGGVSGVEQLGDIVLFIAILAFFAAALLAFAVAAPLAIAVSGVIGALSAGAASARNRHGWRRADR
jgi:hypothetical protein